MSNTTPQELRETYEEIFETDNRVTAGRADALYHTGKLLAGDWSVGLLTDVQNELADTTSPDYDAPYHYGYLTAWNTVAGLVKGEPLKMIAKNHG